MTREITQAVAAYYARTYTKHELIAFYNQSQNDIEDSKALEIAVGIQTGYYGQQLKLEI